MLYPKPLYILNILKLTLFMNLNIECIAGKTTDPWTYLYIRDPSVQMSNITFVFFLKFFS